MMFTFKKVLLHSNKYDDKRPYEKQESFNKIKSRILFFVKIL